MTKEELLAFRTRIFEQKEKTETFKHKYLDQQRKLERWCRKYDVMRNEYFKDNGYHQPDLML